MLAKTGTGKLEQHSSSEVLFLVVSSLAREQEECPFYAAIEEDEDEEQHMKR